MINVFTYSKNHGAASPREMPGVLYGTAGTLDETPDAINERSGVLNKASGVPDKTSGDQNETSGAIGNIIGSNIHLFIYKPI